MVGVIVANTGSPSSPEPDDIERYLREFLMDERIRQLPRPFWKYLVFRHILPKRKHSSAKRYRFIWRKEGSPLITIQQRLVDKVQALYDADVQGGNVKVLSAMSYGAPCIEDALRELRAMNAERVVLLPLYPQSAYSPTMAVVDSFWRAQDAVGWHPESTVIDNYHDHPAYIAAMAHALSTAGFNADAGDRLLFSFHAIPLKDEAAGDTYRAQVAASTELIARELGLSADDIAVSFQSVFGHDESKWTAPLTRDVLRSWRGGDFRVVMACPGFAVDCLETLYDIPHEMVPCLEGEGAAPVVTQVGSDIQDACNTSGRFVWAPSLNDSDEHARMVKTVIDIALKPAASRA